MNSMIRQIQEKYKYLICLAGTVGICWIGVWRDIGNGAQWAFASNCIGFCLLPMILCRFRLKDFLKIPYLVWLVIFLASAYPVYQKLAPGTDYNAQILSAVINAGLYGLIAIRLFIYLFMERKVKIKGLGIIFWLWLGMMIMCVVSRNKAIWPVWYLVMFGAYYLAPVSRKEVRESALAVADGIILSFFWVQIRAFLYRPYDMGAAYLGHFTNANVNGMFYLLSMSGLLTRLWVTSHSVKEEACRLGKKILCVLYFLLSVSILDFTFFTCSRGAFLGVFGMALAYMAAKLVVSVETLRKRWMAFFLKGILVGVTFLALLYPVYACARYIPALRHHPVWYRDYGEEKVHSWDPIDSPKYTTFEQAVGEGLIRKLKTLIGIHEQTLGFIPVNGLGMIFDPSVLFGTAVRTMDYPGGKWVLEYDDGVEPGTDGTHAAFIIDRDETGFPIGYWEMSFPGIRRFIWKYFIERLTLFGHPEINVDVYIDDQYGHTHNSFLQIGYCFGIIAGVFFLVMVVAGIIVSFQRMISVSKRRSDAASVPYILPLVFLVGYLLYGNFECLALTGNFLFSCLFLVIGILIQDPQRSDMIKE